MGERKQHTSRMNSKTEGPGESSVDSVVGTASITDGRRITRPVCIVDMSDKSVMGWSRTDLYTA